MDINKDNFDYEAAHNANKDLGNSELGRQLLIDKKIGTKVLDRYEGEAYHRANSYRDPDTQLLNRRGLKEEFKLVADSLIRSKNFYSYSIIAFDLIGLKKLNEELTPVGADKVIKNAADSLSAVKRETDLLSRYGGDEFVLVAFNADPDGPMRIIDLINNRLPDNVKYCIAHKTFNPRNNFDNNLKVVLNGLEEVKEARTRDETGRVIGDGVVVELG